jgi:hypothetical protein
MDTDENIASYQYYLLILIELLLLMMMLVQSIEMMGLVKLIFVLLSIHCLFLQHSPVYHSSIVLKTTKKNNYSHLSPSIVLFTCRITIQ